MLKQTMAIEASSEWTAACEVQQGFMRSLGRTAELDSSARCRQMQALGGDGYYLTPLDDDRVSLFVGDASGKGLAAALMISNVQSSLRTAASFTGSDGPAALRAVNRQVYESSLADRYATAFYGVFDRDTGVLRYVNAGHPPALVVRADRSIAWLDTGGAPIGMFPDWIYEEGQIQLNPGDMVVAYTDGVIEAMNPEGEEWGLDGLRQAVLESRAHCSTEVLEAVFAAMDEFSQGCQRDDATVVAFQA